MAERLLHKCVGETTCITRTWFASGADCSLCLTKQLDVGPEVGDSRPSSPGFPQFILVLETLLFARLHRIMFCEEQRDSAQQVGGCYLRVTDCLNRW